ncbi:MAG: tetratricopeptide repeat protein [Pirellulaceae bacterium]|nr:tetratricopeptide repeat protein [Pirellulaceae bacterium]
MGPTSDRGTWADQLSKGRYSSRQRATLQMWGSRDDLRDQVQEAARHPDPEVAGRAKWILQQWRRGAVPEMSPRVRALLQQGDDPAAIVELMELGRFASAVIAVQESEQSVEFDAIAERVSRAIALRFPFFVQQAIQTDSLRELIELLDRTAVNKEVAVSRLRLIQSQGVDIDSGTRLLPIAMSSQTLQDQRVVKIVLLNFLGRHDEALAQSEMSNELDFVRISQKLGRQWQALATDGADLAKNSDASHQVTHWVQTLVGADRSGDGDLYSKAIESLLTVSRDDVDFDVAWKALTMHGEVDAALEMLDEQTPEALVDVALAASRPAEAMTKLGFRVSEIDVRLESWISDALDDQLVASTDPDSERELSLSIRRLLALMKCLIAVGRDDQAREIADRLSSETIDGRLITLGRSPNVQTLRDRVLQNLVSTAHSEWVPDLAVQAGERSITASGRWYVARVLPDTEIATLDLMLGAILSLHRHASYHERFSMVCDLLRGEIPDGFDPDRDFDRLFTQLAKRSAASRLAPNDPRTRRSQMNHDIVAFFSRHGRTDLADECLKELVLKGDTEALLELAKNEADSGNAETADQYFQLTWDRVQSNGRGRGLSRASDDDAIIATKAMIGQWLVARRRGDQAQSERLRRQIELTLCSPSTGFINEVAGYLSEIGETELASNAYRAVLPVAIFDADQGTEFYDIARGYATMIRSQNPDDAIRWFDLAVSETIQTSFFRSSAYITLPLFIRRWGLEAAIDRRDAKRARENLDRILKLDPLDITFAEELLPKMRDAGMGEEAYRVFDQVFDDGKEYLKRFPMDATTGNNLAWVAAMNDRRLEEALTMSEHTVFLEPDSAIYRDTLAEILFRMDRKKEALHIEESCLLDDPTQWHLHQQVKKYREAVLADKIDQPN